MHFSRSTLLSFALLSFSASVQASESAEPSVFDYIDTDTYWPMLGVISTPFGSEPNECGMTERQSPIDIDRSVMVSECEAPTTPYFINGRHTGTCDFADMEFSITDHNVGVGLSGCATPPTIRLDNGPNGDGANYTALGMHFHTGSEHSFDTEFADAELHIVHANLNVGDFTYETGDFQVLGVKIRGDQRIPNFRLERLLEQWEHHLEKIEDFCDRGPVADLEASLPVSKSMSQRSGPFNPYDLIPVGTDFYTYEGSLTTPPCSQTVQWNLAADVIHVSESQIDRLFAIVNNYKYPEGSSAQCEMNVKPDLNGWTSRPPQPLNGRVVKKTCGVE